MLVIMIGNFHTTKNMMVCIGKYSEQKGEDHVLIETETFGVNVADQILKRIIIIAVRQYF